MTVDSKSNGIDFVRPEILHLFLLSIRCPASAGPNFGQIRIRNNDLGAARSFEGPPGSQKSSFNFYLLVEGDKIESRK